MALNFQQHEPASAGRLSLIIALAVSLVCVGLYQAEGATGPLHSLQSAVEGAMVPLQRASAPLTEAVDDAGAAAAEGGVTEETYATLRQQNEQLVQQLAAAEEQRLENERLRGLLNLRTTADAMPTLLKPKNVAMLTGLKVMTAAEIQSRYDITLDNYCKTVNIEGRTMVDMARREILPAVEAYTQSLAAALSAKTAAVPALPCSYEKSRIAKLSTLTDAISSAADELDSILREVHAFDDVTRASCAMRDRVLPQMSRLRAVCDEAETLTARSFWPFPTYDDLLFGLE